MLPGVCCHSNSSISTPHRFQFDPVQQLWQHGSELRFRQLKPGSVIIECQVTSSEQPTVVQYIIPDTGPETL
jgi:hypothetical protein